MVRTALIFLIICLVEGCYSTVVRVETDPPGATVHYDYQPRGVTPAEFETGWMGTHKITLDHPEYGRREEFVELKPKPYTWFPLDFLVTILPIKVVDKRTFTYDMTEEVSTATEASSDESEGSKPE
ncbi:MAG TPA: PEGA domain-containing protein [bacterium]|nr:PEGA domain-containing protein [Candidatus Omnitrophota bacterium]HOJ61461.1 PEGA domain-containing protein [bacterium]HOL94914.1 PEGA domain-containing protein [bacterium]HPP01196.1 PEGA domain-containing protein [bacterium]HXK95892.1 PEGA domain-containing protein [bacterium]